MASSFLAFVFLILLRSAESSNNSSLSSAAADSFPASSFRPKAFVLPVFKDAATQQYVATIRQGSPFQSQKLVVDVGGMFPWIDCSSGDYNSTTYRHVPCGSAICDAVNSPMCILCNGPRAPDCGNNTCMALWENTIGMSSTSGNLIQDVVSLQSTDGRNVGPPVTIPNYIFGCGRLPISQRLATGARGMIGLGQSDNSLPAQLATAFNFPKKFAMCLSSSSSGVIFFGDGPYVFLPGIDFLPSLTYTPILKNSKIRSPFESSGEYYVSITSIRVGGKPIPLNMDLLNIDNQGRGGAKISTKDQYTTLHISFYRALQSAFVREAAAMNITRVPAVHPFNTCFSTKNAMQTRVGLWVPPIDLVLHDESSVWQIFGANAVVEVNPEVMCLAFINGGKNVRTTVVLGGHQLEGRLVQFDLGGARLGFSSLLTSSRTSCANFNFGSV